MGEGLAAPWLGALADRVGRRPVFICAITGCAICSIITGVTETYIPLLAARLVAGICGGTASVAAAYISDVTEPEERASYMTYFQAALFGGLSFGPAIGGALDAIWDFSVACYLSAVICLLNALLVIFFLPESKTSEERVALQQAGAARGGMPCQAYTIFFANFLNGVGFTAFEALGALYVQYSFFGGLDGVDAATTYFSVVICGVGVVGMLVNLFLYNRIIPLTGLKGGIAFGGIFSVLSFLCIGIPVNKWWYFVWVQFMVFGENVMGTSVQTVITCVVHPSQFGQALGTMTLFQNIARAFGPFIFSPLFDMDWGQWDLGEGVNPIVWAHSAPWFINSFLKFSSIMLCLSVQLLKPEVPKPPEDGAKLDGDAAGGDIPKSGPERTASLDDTVKRQVSRTTSGSFKTGGLATMARVASDSQGSSQSQALLEPDFREQSLQPIPATEPARG